VVALPEDDVAVPEQLLPIALVSVASDGTQANNNTDSEQAPLSADGRYVAFASEASNLVADDSNARKDIFVHDRQSATTMRVSLASDGTQGNDHSYKPSLSTDGRYVAFHSYASNLVAGDSNSVLDIFVHDRDSGTTTRVSVNSDGVQGNNNSEAPSLSADGRYVAFYSQASNLVAVDGNGVIDLFVHDRQSATTMRVSLASDGTEGNNVSSAPAISADGRYVAFHSYANNLVAGDSNSAGDIFVHDRDSGTTTRVSLDSDGTQGDNHSRTPSISADGRYVAFGSDASNLVTGDTNGTADLFLHDRQTGETTLVSAGLDGTAVGVSRTAAISADGRYVAFHSDAGIYLVMEETNGYSNIFVRDRQTGTTKWVSVKADGSGGNNGADQLPAISADGRYVSFVSSSSDLVAGDTNGFEDIFIAPAQ
jgi:Tol biopolymer transport system component